MIISSLSAMESIVQAKPNLVWDGWDVLEYKKDGLAFIKNNGAFRNGQWMTVRRFEPQRKGWDVPASWAKVLR